jgi:hypothetical protein
MSWLTRRLAYLLATCGKEQAMRFAGKLLYRGKVVLDPARGDLWETATVSGAQEWGGYFDPMNAFITGGECDLVLDDGRYGHIALGSATFTLNKPTAISFRGLGPLK